MENPEKVKLPNEFSRSVLSGRCAVCSWAVEAAEHYDPDFRANYIVIHMAEKHPDILPVKLVWVMEKFVEDRKQKELIEG